MYFCHFESLKWYCCGKMKVLLSFLRKIEINDYICARILSNEN